jgi:hypothetical protein
MLTLNELRVVQRSNWVRLLSAILRTTYYIADDQDGATQIGVERPFKPTMHSSSLSAKLPAPADMQRTPESASSIHIFGFGFGDQSRDVRRGECAVARLGPVAIDALDDKIRDPERVRGWRLRNDR